MRRRPAQAAAALSVWLAAGGLLGAQQQVLPPEIDRLTALGKLWLTVKYFDPAMAYRQDLDWDRAVEDTLPRIRAAQTAAEYETAVDALIRPIAQSSNSSATGQRIWVRHGFPTEDGAPQPATFYSAFLYKPGDRIDQVSIPMGGFSVSVPISEPAAAGPAVPPPSPPAAPSQAVSAFPPVEQRILAAYKLWGVLHYFFAYRDLIDEDWDALLVQFLPRLIDAKDALEYNLALAEWLTHAADTFTAPQSATLAQYFGEATIGLRLRIVEKHVTVTEVLDPEAAQAGIHIGDVVKKVDGETLVDRYRRLEKYVPASTPQRLGADVVARILNGAENSNAALEIEDQAGNRKEVNLQRQRRFVEMANALPAAGETLKLLRGGVGYVDLRRLKLADLDGMFEKLLAAPAIIFDMRGVPAEEGLARALASHLSADNDVAGAIVTGPVVSAPDLPRQGVTASSETFFYLETIGPPKQPLYKGKTLLLVNEQTIGAGERLALFLEAAAKTDFVGSPSAGACSVLTRFLLPGNVIVAFSGEDVRHANGGKLQRLGLQPGVPAEPTLHGIRLGMDEELNAALQRVSPESNSSKTLAGGRR